MKVQITKVPNKMADGGWLSHTHGSDFDSGVDWINEGGSHEENPYGGVMVGSDEQNIPNLVEESEAIWNGDYVFSKRMKVPKKLAKKYGLGEDLTFADAIAKLTKDSEERPLSNIDRATNDHILGEFADTQEELRMAKAQRAMDKEVQLQDDFLTGFQFGLGGYMSPIGIIPDSDNTSIFEKVEQLYADGGGIHIDPSKKGTFKAQASKMGMGVQEAASHILAHKENYSPAMVKKANFAKNFAHAFGGSLFDNPFGEANTFDFGGDLRTRRDTIIRNSRVTEEQANAMLFRMLSKEDRGRAIKERVFGTWTPTYNSNMEIVVPTSTTSNRGNVNGGISRSTGNSKTASQKSIVKSNGTSSGARSKVGPTGLNYYGADPIETFKYWNKEDNDYDEGYRDFIENKLNGDWISRVMNGQYGDMSRYKGANKVNPTIEQAWQLGLDKKNSDWHKAMAAAYDEYLQGIDPKTGEKVQAQTAEPAATRAADSNPEWAVNFGDTPEDNTGFNDTFEDVLKKNSFKPKPTWMRQVPIWMSGLMGLREMFTPADYGNADTITEAAYRVGTPVSIGTEYIGDYRKRDPFDERYPINIINQRGAATNRNMMNLSGGNRAVAMSGILANDLTTQMSLAEAARQAYLANRTDDAQVSEFNRGTNLANMQAQNQRNQFLAGLNSQRQNAMLSGISMGARMGQAIKDQRDAAISANLTNFAQNIGELGRENGFYNMLGGLNDEGILKYFYGDNYTTKFNA